MTLFRSNVPQLSDFYEIGYNDFVKGDSCYRRYATPEFQATYNMGWLDAQADATLIDFECEDAVG